MRPWAPWVDERWVALLTTDTGPWLRASWRARCLFALLARIVSRGDGQITLDGDALGSGMVDLHARLFAEGDELRAPLGELNQLGIVKIVGCSIHIVGWIDGSDLPTGGYARLYTRDTASWMGLSVWARGVFCLLLRSASRNGVHFLGAAGANGLARLIRAPVTELQPVLDELLGPAGIDLVEHDPVATEIRIVAFRDSQETPSSDASRQRAKRERDRADGKNPTSSVTSSHASSRPVTGRHALSRSVTQSHSDPIQSDPIKSSLVPSDTTTPRPGTSSRADAGVVAERRSDDHQSPPTSPSPEIPAAPRRPAPYFAWASDDEQRAGTEVIDRISRAGAKAGEARGPLDCIATPQVARSLLEFTAPDVCGHAGRLELADVLHGVDAIGVSESARLLGPGELPKTTGELSRYLRGGVSKRKRGDARRFAATQQSSAGQLDPAKLKLARDAARWAWKNADSANPDRIIDETDDAAFAGLWAIAEREAGADARWKNFTTNDIQRILAHWMQKYFRSNDKSLIDRGYPISWLMANECARIKSYGLPNRRNAPSIKRRDPVASSGEPAAPTESPAVAQIMKCMFQYISLTDLAQTPSLAEELAKVAEEHGAPVTRIIEILEFAAEACGRQRTAHVAARSDIVRKLVMERISAPLVAEPKASPKL